MGGSTEREPVLNQCYCQSVIELPSEVQSRLTLPLHEWVSAAIQKDSCHIHGQRAACLSRPVAFNVDRMMQERHPVLISLVRIASLSQQSSEGVDLLHLDRMMRRTPWT